MINVTLQQKQLGVNKWCIWWGNAEALCWKLKQRNCLYFALTLLTHPLPLHSLFKMTLQTFTGNNVSFPFVTNVKALWRVLPCADTHVLPSVLQLLILKGSRGFRPFCSRRPLKMSVSLLAISQAYLLLIGRHWHSSERLPMHHTSSLVCSENETAAPSVCAQNLVTDCFFVWIR